MALTEMLFITLLVLALWKLDTWLARPTRAALVVCTAAVAAACLTRYQGLALAATLGLVILGLGPGPLVSRLRVGHRLVPGSPPPCYSGSGATSC